MAASGARALALNGPGTPTVSQPQTSPSQTTHAQNRTALSSTRSDDPSSEAGWIAELEKELVRLKGSQEEEEDHRHDAALHDWGNSMGQTVEGIIWRSHSYGHLVELVGSPCSSYVGPSAP